MQYLIDIFYWKIIYRNLITIMSEFIDYSWKRDHYIYFLPLRWKLLTDAMELWEQENTKHEWNDMSNDKNEPGKTHEF